MKQKWISRVLSLALVAAFVPGVAMAETYDIANGDIVVQAEADGSQYVAQGGGQSELQTTETVITGSSDQNTVSIEAEQGATANVTLDNVNINVSNTGVFSTGAGKGAVTTSGEGSVTIELEGKNTLKSGSQRAGLDKDNTGNLTIQDKDGDGSLEATGGFQAAGIGGSCGNDASNIIITGGHVEANGGEYAAGIGGGSMGNGSKIQITGNAQVSANGGISGAGIGGGSDGSGSDIVISGNAQVEANSAQWGAGIGGGGAGTGSNITVSDGASVKVSGGVETITPTTPVGAGAGIGNGGQVGGDSGDEVAPDFSNLSTGKIEYYAPGSDFDRDKPEKTVTGTKKPAAPPAAEPVETPTVPAEATVAPALYRVTALSGSPLPYGAARKDGVLTLTVTADTAILTGTLSGLRTLVDEGVTQITLTNGAISAAFSPADLLTKGTLGDTYALTLQENPTLTLNGETVEL